MQTYEEIKEFIKTNESILNTCLADMKKINEYLTVQIKKSTPKGYSEGISYVDADTIHGGKSELRSDHIQLLLADQRHLENMIYLQEERLKKYYKARDEMETGLSKLTGLRHRVYYLHTVEGLTLQEVADKLGYTYSHISSINSEISKIINNDK